MNWINFEKKFLATAKQNKYSNKYIQDWLSYAKILYNNKVPIIFDYLHFSYLVGIHHTYIFKVANATGKFYRTFKIPKKSGGLRVIKEPLPNLKIIQRWILNNILIYQPISEFTKAYRIGHSIKDNARFHLNQKILLKIDIENYFGTIHSKNVYCFFRSLGYTKQLSTLFTNLCCLDHSLPQGATTSPMLSNI